MFGNIGMPGVIMTAIIFLMMVLMIKGLFRWAFGKSPKTKDAEKCGS